jgi:hypothetical protein
VKRATKGAWPRRIVEVPSGRSDPRADPQATQKISREMLDDALRRTKSGTRPAMRSEIDDDLFGPRDSAPEITIVKIDSMELSLIDPASLPPAAAEPAPLATHTPSHVTPIPPIPRAATGQRWHVTPRLAFVVGLVMVAFVGLAAFVGFLAGRVTSP